MQEITGLEQVELEGQGMLPELLRELIRTANFQEILKSQVKSIDPENARRLVRTLLWQDVNFSFGMMGALPGVINWLAAALDEMAVQVSGVPPLLLRSFMNEMGQGIEARRDPEAYEKIADNLFWDDPETIGKALDNAVNAANNSLRNSVKTFAKFERYLADRGDGGREVHLDKKALGDSVNASLMLFVRILDSNPDMFEGMLSSVDKRALVTVAGKLLRMAFRTVTRNFMILAQEFKYRGRSYAGRIG